MDLARIVSVAAAICAAASFGAAGLLQHRATHQAPSSEPLHPRLLLDLIRITGFRWGVLLGALGFALQIIALAFGPLTLVQPLLVTGVLFYLGFAAALMHRAPDRALLASALVAIAGLSGFLALARPTSGEGSGFEGADALPLGIVLFVVVAACLLVASRLPHELAALPLAVATAVCYGVTAGLVRSLVVSIDVGILLSQWQLYAVIVVGPAGFLLNQNAFQEGTLGSVAVATITVGDPIAAIAVGMVWLGESLVGGSGRIAAEVVSLLVMAIGILLLTRRAEQVGQRMRAEGRGRTETQQ